MVQGIAVSLSLGSLFQWLQHVNMKRMLSLSLCLLQPEEKRKALDAISFQRSD